MLFARALPRLVAAAAVLAILLACAPRAALAQTTLLAYYTFDGDARDMSGNGHHGVVRGAQLTTDRFGIANSAYYFNGRASIAVPHSDDLKFGHDEPFTIGAWVRFCRPQNDFAGIVVKGPGVTYRPGYQFVIRAENRAATVISIDDDDWVGAIGATPMDDGIWHLMTLVVDPVAGWLRIYVDGRQDAVTYSSRITPDFQDHDSSLFIGRDRNAHVWFDGAIDDVFIMSGTLDEPRILELYREGGWSRDVARGRRFDVAFCRGSGTMLSAPGEFPAYQWSNGASTRSITVSRAGRYTVRSLDQVGCGPVDTFDVIVTDGPRLVHERSVGICLGDSVQIGAPAQGSTPPVRYRWSPAEGLSDTSSATPVASPRRPTLYRVLVSDGSGCEIADSVLVSMLPAPVIQAPDTVALCNGESVVLPVVASGEEPLQYQWSPPEGLDDPRLQRPRASPTRPTTYVLTVTGANGCSASDSVTVNPAPAGLLNAGPDITLCPGQEATIGGQLTGGSEPVTYAWLPATGLSSPTVAQPVVRATTSRDYIVFALDSRGCRYIDTVHITVREATPADAGVDRLICRGDSVIIGGTAQGGVNYRWVTLDGQEVGRGPTAIVRPPFGALYVLEAVEPGGCVGRDTVLVSVNWPPLTEAGADAVLCSGGAPILLGGETNGGRLPYTFRWEPARGLSSTTDPRPIATPDTTTTYRVIVTDANGCTDTSEVTIVVEERGLEVVGLEAGVVAVRARGAGDGCDTVLIRNASSVSATIEAATFAVNHAFSLPPAQFPITIPAGQTRPVIVCFAPDSSGGWHDSLLFATRACAYRVALAGSRARTSLEGDVGCSTVVQFRPDTSSILVRVRAVRPNPASEQATVELEVAGDDDPIVTATLIDLSGRAIGSWPARILERRRVGPSPVVVAVADIPTAGFASGSYLVIIAASGQQFAVPLTISR